jgi:DNA-binding NarL/FixJ family response regulator
LTHTTFLLCDDHALFREGLAALLEKQPGWRVVAQAADGDEALRLAAEHQPDLAVLDVSMPGVDGIAAASLIRDAFPGIGIIALSMYGDAHYQRRMFKAGAKAYVMKKDASVELVAAVNAVLRGETYTSPTLDDPALSQPQRSIEVDIDALSPREREVFRLLALGRRPKEIAEVLGIGVKTVETHRSRLMLKLGIDNLADLIKAALRAGIVSID